VLNAFGVSTTIALGGYRGDLLHNSITNLGFKTLLGLLGYTQSDLMLCVLIRICRDHLETQFCMGCWLCDEYNLCHLTLKSCIDSAVRTMPIRTSSSSFCSFLSSQSGSQWSSESPSSSHLCLAWLSAPPASELFHLQADWAASHSR
jgi:hypothetical protein